MSKKNNPGCGCCTPCTSGHPDSITDNFNRADENPIQFPWVSVNAELLSNQINNAYPGSSGAQAWIKLAPASFPIAAFHSEVRTYGRCNMFTSGMLYVRMEVIVVSPGVVDVITSIADNGGPWHDRTQRNVSVPFVGAGYIMLYDIDHNGGNNFDVTFKVNGATVDNATVQVSSPNDNDALWCQTSVLLTLSGPQDDFDAHFTY